MRLATVFLAASLLLTTASAPQQPDKNCEFVTHALRQIQAIKPGTSRAELMKIFAVDGGLSTVDHQRFVFRDCPYIKVDVDFGPDNRILKISKPYLEDMYAD